MEMQGGVPLQTRLPVALALAAGLVSAQSTRLPRPAAPAPFSAPHQERLRAAVQSLPRLRAGVDPEVRFRPDGSLQSAVGFTSQPYFGEAQAAARSFLRDYGSLFAADVPPEFEITRVRKIGAHTVVRLEQTAEGIPVHGKDLVLLLDSMHAVKSVSANYAPPLPRRGVWSPAGDAEAVALSTQAPGGRALQTNRVWFATDDALEPAWRVVVEGREGGLPAHWAYVVSAETGEVLESQDLRMGQSRQGRAVVYPANPAVGELAPVLLKGLADGTPYLAGANVRIYSNLAVLAGAAPPGTVVPIARADADGDYPYPPADPRHAEVQLYWALDQAARNFQSIGYPGLPNALSGVVLWADCGADGCTSQKNAFFNSQAFSGQGGVYVYYSRTGEPAHDSDVMFHEYTHAVINDLVGSAQGQTFRALNEGSADYFSDSFQNDPVMGEYAALVWELRLPFLRTAGNANLYPRNLVGEVHLDGNIWSGALWDLRKVLGPAQTDLAVLLTIASISASAEYYDAATAAVNVTRLLYGSTAASAARQILLRRGLLSATAELAANPRLLRSGALPVIDSIARAPAGGGVLAARQFRFSLPLAASSAVVRVAGNDAVVALLKHRSPVEVYDDGTTNADYVSATASEVTLSMDQASDPEIQFGDYYLWIGHFNSATSTEYAAYLRVYLAGNDPNAIRIAEVRADGSAVTGSMPAGPGLNSREFGVMIPATATGAGFKVEGETDVDLFVKFAAPVLYNQQGFPEADVVRPSAASTEVAILTRRTVPALVPGPYVLGVFNADESSRSRFLVSAITTTAALPAVTTVPVPARATASVEIGKAYGAAVLADQQLALDVPAGATELRITIDTSIDAQVYVRHGAQVGIGATGWPVADYSFRTSGRRAFDLTTSSATPLKPGRYYLWIANASESAGAVALSYSTQ